MSDNHRLPIDESVLNAFWNEVVSGSETDPPLASQVPADVVQAICSITAIDPAPQSSKVRERAWAETWERIRPTPQEREQPAMYAVSRSRSPRLSQSIPVSEQERTAPFHGRIDRRLMIAFSLIAATLLAIAAYGLLDPFDSDPGPGPVIPAVVMYEATPVATPAGEHKLTIDLPAALLPSTGPISAAWDYVEVPSNQTYSYVGYCCPGPFIEYVLTGQLTVSSDAAMTIFRADGSSESIPVATETNLLAGDAFLADNEAGLVVTNNGVATTQLLGWVLVNDGRFSGHAVGGFPLSRSSDVQYRLTVNPGPGQLVVTRYESLDQIPAPAPNSYQFVVHAYHTSDGEAKVTHTRLEPAASPVAGYDSDGFYVLDFLMSPPSKASPTTGTPAA